MTNRPKAPAGAVRNPSETLRDAKIVLANRAAKPQPIFRDEGAAVMDVVDEGIDVAKRHSLTGIARVSTTAEAVEECAEAELGRRVEVTCGPVGPILEKVFVARTDGDAAINRSLKNARR